MRKIPVVVIVDNFMDKNEILGEGFKGIGDLVVFNRVFGSNRTCYLQYKEEKHGDY
jgi:hypothetical protein